ncbi:MAG: tripartite tricarboxylate transporter substrate binding protein, partial [Alphaproteobacteria bacterium]|nr:tripartite tricarboxylate transporter substrate binding protein [Alphaproteobacteria bacterium]
MRKTASMILAAAVGLLLAGTAMAQERWPSRTITIVGGFP